MTDFSNDELSKAQRFARPIGRFMSRWRERIRRRPWLNVVYRVLISILGALIVIVGLILVPLPGPGWLIVFIGMTVLGAEYRWARRLTSWLRMTLARLAERWQLWRARRASAKGRADEGSEARDQASAQQPAAQTRAARTPQGSSRSVLSGVATSPSEY